MATYYTKSCPYCRHKYQVHGSKKQYGTPFRVCLACQKRFIDTDFVEISLLPPSKIRVHLISPVYVIYTAFWAYFMFLFWVPTQLSYNLVTIIPFLIGVALIVDDIANYRKRVDAVRIELQLSRERTSNPEYITALKSIGYELVKNNDDQLTLFTVDPPKNKIKEVYLPVLVAFILSAVVIAGLAFLVINAN